MRRKTAAELKDIFLWEEQRMVDKTGCVRLDGNTFEVDLDLCRKRIQLRYDPFDPTEIQVWLEGVRYANATVVDLFRPYDRRVKPEPEPAAAAVTVEPDGQLAFLELAEQKRQAQWKHEEISYAKVKDGDVESMRPRRQREHSAHSEKNWILPSVTNFMDTGKRQPAWI